MKTTTTHPSWCAAYRCTAAHAIGEHRSQPLTLLRAGRRVSVVVSLVRRPDRAHTTAEIRMSVRLTSSTDAGQAREVWSLLRRLARVLREEVR